MVAGLPTLGTGGAMKPKRRARTRLLALADRLENVDCIERPCFHAAAARVIRTFVDAGGPCCHEICEDFHTALLKVAAEEADRER